jgi:hypothetical protein
MIGKIEEEEEEKKIGETCVTQQENNIFQHV